MRSPVMRLNFLATGSLNLQSNSQLHCQGHKTALVNEVISSGVTVMH